MQEEKNLSWGWDHLSARSMLLGSIGKTIFYNEGFWLDIVIQKPN